MKIYSGIRFQSEDGIGFITLNRPDKRNALSKNLMAEMIVLLKSIKSDKQVRVVILRAEGSVFSSGHDLSEMLEGDAVFYREIFHACTEMMEAIRDLPQPVIAQVQGMATAAGCQLVATCDLVVASKEPQQHLTHSMPKLLCLLPSHVTTSRRLSTTQSTVSILSSG